MKTIQDLKKEQENKVSELLKNCLVFFAFSNEQFEQGKTPLQEGEKYVSIGAGGYLPKGKVNDFTTGMDNITKWYKSEIKANKAETAQILYELSNYECWYTGDIEDALPSLNMYPIAQVQEVFNANYKKYSQSF